MKFEIPEGLEVDIDPGQTTELLLKVKLNDDMTLTGLEVDGVALPEEVEEEEVEDEITDEEVSGLLAEDEAAAGGQEVPDMETALMDIGSKYGA